MTNNVTRISSRSKLVLEGRFLQTINMTFVLSAFYCLSNEVSSFWYVCMALGAGLFAL